MWIVYVIQNDQTNEIYIGITSDLKQRIQTHNSRGKKFTTRKVGEWILVYAEAYRNQSDAITREKRLKNHGNAKIELFKRIKDCLLDTKTGEGRSERPLGDCLSKTQLRAKP